ncbi:unnamed protein product [Paramecium primaurelia]|uniref:Uncharacterized protein n=1 Tax=Paramecium primaurelia TaxID=5886 RepID=A0A8S1P072_PARPR|nr:unnamed protein product [Paramecium primaurelia]
MQAQYCIVIKFDKANNTYRPNDFISGQATITFTDPNQKRIEISSLKWRSEGAISCQNKDSHKELQKIMQNYNPQLLHLNQGEFTQEKYILQEKNTFQFKYQLTPYGDSRILETYVGVYVAIAYEIQVELILNNGIAVRNSTPFYVQCLGIDKIGQQINFKELQLKQEQFIITPDRLLGNQSVQNKQNAKFKIHGIIDSAICQFQEGFNGSVNVEECESEIRTIDLQMIRVEKLENRFGKVLEATEIQLIQIVDGNITKGIQVPFNMIFPKFFSCSNFQFKEFSVDFEVNLVVIMYDGFKITLNFPIHIIRK